MATQQQEKKTKQLTEKQEKGVGEKYEGKCQTETGRVGRSVEN